LTGTATTLYRYDALDNLICAVQTGTANPSFSSCAASPASWRPRSFVYDSLSRLTSATNPESGTISYTYDANGNVQSKTAPEPNATSGSPTVTTTYTYDALNRLTQKSYSGMTAATVQYAYDGNALSGCTTTPPPLPPSGSYYQVGRRTAMCDGSGAVSWAYDKMGRMGAESRTIGSVAGLQTQYNYNLDGSVNWIQYPSRRTVNYTYSGAARALSAIDSSTANYVTAARYTAPGQLSAAANGASILTANSYNNRLQPVTLAAVAGSQLLFSLNYDFHWGTGDNGNVYNIVNNRPNDSFRSQHFTYDSLNRIQQAWNSGGSNGWGESYTTDIWGNLTNIGGISSSCQTSETLNAFPASPANQLAGNTYDIAGNLIGTGQYAYDAENRISTTASGYTYTYDGDGQRVQKSNGSTGTLYWTGNNGEVLAESDLSGNFTEYIYFNGQRVARRDSSGNPHYYFSDHLGSHDVVANASGGCEQDIDFYPYGGQVNDYCPTQVPQHYKFTGKERDAETQLDYFGARHYGSNMGRFMGVDPVWVKADRIVDPQRLNLYAYTRNNPLKFIDPFGEELQIGNCGSNMTVSQCANIVQQGLTKQDRSHTSVVKGDGSNGCSKGAYCLAVDANYKSSSGDFQRLQWVANKSDIATIQFKGANDTVSSFSFVGVPLASQTKSMAAFSYEPTMNKNTGFMGLTLEPIRGPLDSVELFAPMSLDDKTHIIVANGPGSGMSMDDIIGTIHHEIAHIYLSDFGRTRHGDHGYGNVDQITGDAQNEAVRNSQQK
jgi:RHS repeat-associated protein